MLLCRSVNQPVSEGRGRVGGSDGKAAFERGVVRSASEGLSGLIYFSVRCDKGGVEVKGRV
ncbi:hypothetical protein E2C01_075124 [Portunus trituberculatus]|uniref:Uncharacterized protein n=1 Tax=Portunus trituberculatus TaxID=210409 RepID=A0A5B7IJ38_PORTR|nr:hypothetical protein [Portunus trituberculatus]